EHRLRLDWSAFEGAQVVEAVPLEIRTSRRGHGARKGTVIKIEDLRTPLAEQDVKRLARALVLLADPFRTNTEGPSDDEFHPRLLAEGFEDLERLVECGYRDEADYYLRAELDAEGRASAFVRDYQGVELFRAGHQDISRGKGHPTYSAPSAVFELW